MALADPLSFSPDMPTQVVTNPRSYRVIRRGVTDTSRMLSTADVSLPETVDFKHSTTGSEKNGGVITDRHLISFVKTERAANGVAHKAIVNLTVTVPRAGLHSATEIGEMIAMICNFIVSSTNRDNFLRGES